jgi:TPR repeat protein
MEPNRENPDELYLAAVNFLQTNQPSLAVGYLERAASLGHTEANFELGNIYELGSQFVNFL